MLRERDREDMMCRYEVNKHYSQKIVVLRKAFKASHTINFFCTHPKKVLMLLNYSHSHSTFLLLLLLLKVQAKGSLLKGKRIKLQIFSFKFIKIFLSMLRFRTSFTHRVSLKSMNYQTYKSHFNYSIESRKKILFV